ncbi:putative LysM domain protein [Aspergillus thermomutatus]|uniref:LysM domain-containing protein n=1 Tax=Aspergillus thermomutatus TaxID=41047 RepID=A0A397GBL4_ASPTH|nr:uncharacterized protein CDV56_103371 [Aspergillus thermomutatus]RHZ48402.1 hypothetical protein CDV56_103371 [Aspergillus thermomutatus]
MKPSTFLLASLLARAGASSSLRKKWLNGDSATGTTDPDVTSDCEYWANDISSSDTCAGLEAYFDVTFAELKAWNPSLLESYCVLIEGWSYCVAGPAVTTTAAATGSTATDTSIQKITFTEVGDLTNSTTAVATITATATTTVASASPTTPTYSGGIPSPTQSGLIPTCDVYYYVQSGNTCYSIQDIYGNFTLTEFYTWNPSITTGCSGLQPGYYVCIGVAGASASTTTSSSPYEPQQTGITANCDAYYLVAAGDDCSAILSEYDITMAEFYAWNPAVGSNCNTMQAGYYVCVGVSATGPSPTQSGITADCVTYYQAVSGDSCWSIVTQKYPYLNETEFIDWNPAVGSDCSGLWVGYYYCVATTTARPMPGIISTCTSYYLVQSGDSCWSIEQAYSISAANFSTWNPDVGTSCASLWEGYYVCVGV